MPVGDAIKVQTIHSVKGLQYRAVLVLWTDALAKGET
jgi:ATP-dependent exoDNAse (exonuclease V) beta subunit